VQLAGVPLPTLGATPEVGVAAIGAVQTLATTGGVTGAEAAGSGGVAAAAVSAAALPPPQAASAARVAIHKIGMARRGAKSVMALP